MLARPKDKSSELGMVVKAGGGTVTSFDGIIPCFLEWQQ
jgi:hypothetical protein